MLMMIAVLVETGNEDADDVNDDNDDDENDDDDDDDDKKSWSKQKWQSKQLFPRFSRRSAQILQKKCKMFTSSQCLCKMCICTMCAAKDFCKMCTWRYMCTARYIWRM